MRRIRHLFFIVMALAIALTGCKSNINVAEVIGTDKMKVEKYHASFVIDESDITQVTTYASYVFVAEVVDYDKTEYINDDEDSPVTYYHVRVKENIKGELTTEEDIVLKKAGGIKKNSDTFMVCEGDVLPQIGKTYLFAAVIWEDDLYCPMPNMVVEVDASSDVLSSADVVKYKEACDNPTPDVPNGDQYKSRYDVGEAK
ncbi:MAG: hypothetical protein K6F92_10630 [Lachnospiraceae bacterium]|nr:hypothetical protein [Lachnospiraceae bacterium]